MAITKPTELIKTVTSSATPEKVAATSTPFRVATVMGKKAARTNNTGTVWLGLAATNDSQSLEITPGEIKTIEVPPNIADWDLTDFYLDVATNGDGVIIWYCLR